MHLTVVNSKGFQMSIYQSHRIKIQRVKIYAPESSPNTDGVHISLSEGCILNKLTVATSDDCVSLGPGVTNLTVARVKCGPVHGISVGSLGRYDDEPDVNGVFVRNCTLKDTHYGLRIKSYQGSKASGAYKFTTLCSKTSSCIGLEAPSSLTKNIALITNALVQIHLVSKLKTFSSKMLGAPQGIQLV